MNDLGLSNEVINTITQVISKDPKINKAKVYGSRSLGNHRKYSDIDIAIYASVDYEDTYKISYALYELPIIYKCDVVLYESIKNEELKDHIDRVAVEIFNRNKEDV